MNIKELSESLGVNESYVSSFIEMIMIEMRKDKVDDVFLTLSESEMVGMVQAYASFVAKRFSEFYTTYITNTNVNSIFNDIVFATIKYNANNNFVNVHWYSDSAINDLFVLRMAYVKGSGIGFVNGYKKIESINELKISVKNENVWTML